MSYRPLLLSIFLFSIIAFFNLRAETYDSVDVTAEQNASIKPIQVKQESAPIAQEASFNYSYVGATDMKQGTRGVGDVDENSGSLHYVVSPEIADGYLFRIGAEAERYSFGDSAGGPLPNTLQAISAVIGADIQASDNILLRVETQPGIYSDFTDVRTSSINAPLIVGGSYLYSKDLQFFFGLSMNVNRHYPVLPGAGLRWHYADDWTLNFLLPKPRLEYDVNKNLKAYLGADLMGNTFQVSQNFGDTHGNPRLDNTMVDYTEIRIGPGIAWKFSPNLTLEAETGAMVYRDYDFYRDHTSIHNNDPAPYAQVAISGSF